MMQCLNMANYWPAAASGRGARWWRRCGHHAHAYEGSERDGMEWMCSRRLPCDLLWVPMLMPWMQSERAMMPVATQRAVILMKGREHTPSAIMCNCLIGYWSFDFFFWCFVEQNSSSTFFMCLDWPFPLLIFFSQAWGSLLTWVCNLLDLLCGFFEKQKKCDVMAAARA